MHVRRAAQVARLVAEAEAEVRRDLAEREAAGRARVEAEAAEQRRELDRALTEAAEQVPYLNVSLGGSRTGS